MNTAVKQDLRVCKTRDSIRGAFADMLLEMPYEKITVTELSKRANINKKTFYRHYPVLDNLLQEVELEFVEPFVELTTGLRYPDDVDAVTREFLLYSSRQGALYDAMMSNEMHGRILTSVIDEMGAERAACNEPPSGWDDEEWSLYVSTVNASQVYYYRHWVQEGRKVPVNRMVALGVRLISRGANLGRA